MAKARIYSPANNIMQSGKAHAGKWVLEFEPSERKTPDSLMGWAGSGDMTQQVKVRFDSRDEAVGYAERAGLDFDVIEARPAKLHKRDYAAKFAFDRIR